MIKFSNIFISVFDSMADKLMHRITNTQKVVRHSIIEYPRSPYARLEREILRGREDVSWISNSNLWGERLASSDFSSFEMFICSFAYIWVSGWLEANSSSCPLLYPRMSDICFWFAFLFCWFFIDFPFQSPRQFEKFVCLLRLPLPTLF